MSVILSNGCECLGVRAEALTLRRVLEVLGLLKDCARTTRPKKKTRQKDVTQS